MVDMRLGFMYCPYQAAESTESTESKIAFLKITLIVVPLRVTLKGATRPWLTTKLNPMAAYPTPTLSSLIDELLEAQRRHTGAWAHRVQTARKSYLAALGLAWLIASSH